MKLATKWLLCYLCSGAYAGLLGGVFCRGFFQWTFDEKLKTQAIDLVRDHAPALIKGLSRSPLSITLEEFDALSGALAKDERVAELLYLDRRGEVRWHKDPRMIGQSFEEFARDRPMPTDALAQAHAAGEPQLRAVPGRPFYEVAVPLSVRGELGGIVDLQVSRRAALAIVARGMRSYALGALGVLLLLGLPLYLFLRRFLIVPVVGLRDAVAALSCRNLELRYAERTDELGEAADALRGFLDKLKAQRSGIQAEEKLRAAAEEGWWKSMLGLLAAEEESAIVVDEDNSVLYAKLAGAEPLTPERPRHLLDIFDGQQQELLRLVGAALDHPQRVVESDADFRGEGCRARAIHLESPGRLRRTLILLRPRRRAESCLRQPQFLQGGRSW